MKNNKGFVFIETIVVLTVTMISLLSLYNGYVLTLKKVEQKKFYDNINDVYKLNIFNNLLKDGVVSYNNVIDSDKNNCSISFDPECQIILNYFKNEDNISLFIGSINEINNIDGIKNTMKIYLKTLDNNKKYIVGSYKLSGKNKFRYASLELGRKK